MIASIRILCGLVFSIFALHFSCAKTNTGTREWTKPRKLRSYYKSDNDNNSLVLRVNPAALRRLITEYLVGSVQLFRLSNNIQSKHEHAMDICESSEKKGFSHFIHQHAGEVWVPALLQHHPHTQLLQYHNSTHKSTEPLFKLIDAYPFLIINCGPKHTNWEAYRPYMQEVMQEVKVLDEFKQYLGLNFVMSASNPCTPTKLWEPANGAFGRMTFLTTAVDCFGHARRDIVIPHCRSYDGELLNGTVLARDKIVFWMSRPLQFTRSRMLAYFSNRTYSDIVITDKYMPRPEYVRQMMGAKFCLVVRGDVIGTSRLIDTIAHGCVPVFIGDWVMMPYERFIDYNKFIIFIEEGFMLGAPEAVLQLLREVPVARLVAMQAALREAASMLMYDSDSLFNPVTLAVAEIFMRRLQECRTRFKDEFEQPRVKSGGEDISVHSLCAQYRHRLSDEDIGMLERLYR